MTKKQTKNKVIVNFILDRSGSMTAIKDATISGFNEYIATLKADKKTEYTFSLVLFDDFIENPITDQSLESVVDLNDKTFVPRGFTALYDAVCRTLKDYKTKGKTITIIMTDGMENASKEYKQADMRNLVKELEATGKHTFVYLGANQDSYAVGSALGFSAQNTTNFNATGGGGGAAFRGAAMGTVSYSAQSVGATMNFFSEKDQRDIENTK